MWVSSAWLKADTGEIKPEFSTVDSAASLGHQGFFHQDQGLRKFSQNKYNQNKELPYKVLIALNLHFALKLRLWTKSYTSYCLGAWKIVNFTISNSQRSELIIFYLLASYSTWSVLILLLREGWCKVTFAKHEIKLSLHQQLITASIKDQAGHIPYLLATGNKIFITIYYAFYHTWRFFK